MKLDLHFPNPELKGTITLAGSKSISNRVLIIRALCSTPFPVKALANANDTDLLARLLESDGEILNAGPAGTTFRFMTAYLSLQEGNRVLTGSERMQQRPISVLVEALRQLGADITYLGKEGFPPLRIVGSNMRGGCDLAIPADTSSQYISAILMVAPSLPGGLSLTLTGKIVSRPYIEMTLELMAYFGVTHHWEGQTIRINPQAYSSRPITIEADWSAASYYYALAALSRRAEITLNGLFADSLQGDAVLADLFQPFGVETRFTEMGIHLSKRENPIFSPFAYDFLRCPDLAQTLAVVCAATGTKGRFQGLETLRIKETDRIAALENELSKGGCHIIPDGDTFLVSGKFDAPGVPCFQTYEDHRMAMALAPLALLQPISMEHPEVVGKSYPDFWRDLAQLGAKVREIPSKALPRTP